ncbi:MAG: L-threonylcarbamoyladenylate synthase [Oceanicaulis sp.]
MRPPLPDTTPIRPANDPAALDEAAAILRAGGCVAVPTETVYGLACDASNAEAVAGVYEAKGRPRFNPLIAHVRDLAHAERLVDLPETGRRLAEAFWPGPLTIVAPKRPDAPVSDLAAAGLDTLAVRAPASPAMAALIAAAGAPLAAPSANRSGAVSPTRAEHVAESLSGRIHLILDGGPCAVGVESTIVAVTGDPVRLLRPGGTPRAEIERVCGHALSFAAGASDRPEAPGQLTSHYAPRSAVRMNASAPEPDEAFLAFGEQRSVNAVRVMNLSPRGDLAEAAANLFSGLRALDGAAPCIAVAPIPDYGLGEAINDRLRRASARKD